MKIKYIVLSSISNSCFLAMIKAVNVTVMVKDLDAAIRFYSNVLGFNLLNQYGPHWADMEGPGINIGLHPTDKEIKLGDNLQIGIKVDDLEVEMNRLKKSEVTFERNNDDQVTLATFKDPDGNILYLIQGD